MWLLTFTYCSLYAKSSNYEKHFYYTDVCERVWIGATSIFHLSFLYIIQNHDRYYEWACVSSIFTLSFNHKHHFCSVFAILHCSYFIFFLFVDDHHGIEFPLFKYFRKKLRKTQTERRKKELCRLLKRMMSGN